MKIGYVRVSKYEQNEALQIDVLKAAGCEKMALRHLSCKEMQFLKAASGNSYWSR